MLAWLTSCQSIGGASRALARNRVTNSLREIPSLAARETPLSSASGEEVAGRPGWVCARWLRTCMQPTVKFNCPGLSGLLVTHDDFSHIRMRLEVCSQCAYGLHIAFPRVWHSPCRFFYCKLDISLIRGQIEGGSNRTSVPLTVPQCPFDLLTQSLSLLQLTFHRSG